MNKASKRKKTKALRREERAFLRAMRHKQGVYVRDLLARATPAERKLRDALTARGIRFKFQHSFMTPPVIRVASQIDKNDTEPCRFYIVDFLLRTIEGVNLVVEVDGPSHKTRVAYDADRTAWLTRIFGCLVIRFTNADVYANVSAVVDAIELHRPTKQGDQDRVKLAPLCRSCGKPTKPKWIMFKNNHSVHLVWFCCGKQRSPCPIPGRFAKEYGLSDKQTATARLIIENDVEV